MTCLRHKSAAMEISLCKPQEIKKKKKEYLYVVAIYSYPAVTSSYVILLLSGFI